MAIIERTMMRCLVETCRRWWSIGPGDLAARCACGGELGAVDMKAHIESLPMRQAVHNHLSAARQPRGSCEACDAAYFAEDKTKAEAKKAST